MDKNQIRKEAKEARRLLSFELIEEKSDAACKLFLESNIYKNAKSVMIYKPLGNEVKTENIEKRALSDGKQVLLPITDMESFEIAAAEVDGDTVYKKGAFSIFVPCEVKSVHSSKIDVVIVPGVAFSKDGARVGFGKGCYDRFLANTNAIKIGLCYECQLFADIPEDPHDVRMDYIVTEKQIIACDKKIR